MYVILQCVCTAKLALVHVRLQPLHVEEHKDQLQLHIRIRAEHSAQVPRRLPHMHNLHDRGGRGHGCPPHLEG